MDPESESTEIDRVKQSLQLLRIREQVQYRLSSFGIQRGVDYYTTITDVNDCGIHVLGIKDEFTAYKVQYQLIEAQPNLAASLRFICGDQWSVWASVNRCTENQPGHSLDQIVDDRAAWTASDALRYYPELIPLVQDIKVSERGWIFLDGRLCLC